MDLDLCQANPILETLGPGKQNNHTVHAFPIWHFLIIKKRWFSCSWSSFFKWWYWPACSLYQPVMSMSKRVRIARPLRVPLMEMLCLNSKLIRRRIRKKEWERARKENEGKRETTGRTFTDGRINLFSRSASSASCGYPVRLLRRYSLPSYSV